MVYAKLKIVLPTSDNYAQTFNSTSRALPPLFSRVDMYAADTTAHENDCPEHVVWLLPRHRERAMTDDTSNSF